MRCGYSCREVERPLADAVRNKGMNVSPISNSFMRCDRRCTLALIGNRSRGGCLIKL